MTVGDSAVEAARLLDADGAGDVGASPPAFCAVLAAAASCCCCWRVEERVMRPLEDWVGCGGSAAAAAWRFLLRERGGM